MIFHKTALLVFAIAVARTTVAASTEEQKIAFVTELNQAAGNERSLELFPDTLDVEVETDAGVEELHLVKQKSINARSIPVEYDVPELNQRQFKLTKDVAYYQDLENMAPIKVEATVEGGMVKRTLTGTLIHNKRAYEIHPGSSFLQSMTDLLEEKGLGSEHGHRVHVLKMVNIRDYLRPDKIKLTTEQEERRRELEKQTKEEQTLKTFLRLLNAQNKQEELKRSKRYATHSTTNFHVEMLFVVDYSVYKFWMDQHNNDTDEVHETLLHYYAHIFNGMHMSYRRIDHDKHNIAVILWLVKIHIITEPDNELAVPKEKFQGQAEEDEVFGNLQNFQQEHYDWTYPDHIMLWTKSDLAADYDEGLGKLTADLLGVAFMCGVCHPKRSLSQNEDNGIFSWATGAHELGHNLGSHHDGTGDNNCHSSNIYLMYISDYTLDGDIVKTAFEFSDCSVEQFKECFTGHFKYNLDWPLVCVYDTVCEHNIPPEHLDDLPGQLYNLTEQCQLFVDPNATAEPCEDENVEICETLKCYIPAEDKCVSEMREFRAAPGTPCNGSSPNSVCTGDDCVCYEGRCLDRENIKTLTKEPEPSCSEVKYTPPEGCENNAYSDCNAMVLNSPWRCFTSNYYKESCRASCYEYGVFYVEDPPCSIPSGGQVPEQTTGTAASAGPQFCSQTRYPKEGGMTCPDDPTHCIPMSWFCDGEGDCDDNSDENVEICIQVPSPRGQGAKQYLRCKDDPSTYYPEDFQQDGYKFCPGGSDEDPIWGQEAPRYCFNRFSNNREGFNCPSDHTKCVQSSDICNGVNDCNAAVGEIGDETPDFCDSLQCMKNQLRCPNEANDHSLKCIKRRNVCNGFQNCPNGGDEELDWCLANGVEPVCDEDEVLCPHQSTYQCVERSKACDTVGDCEQAGDEYVDWCEEEGLLPDCPQGEILCPGEKFQCFPRSATCDTTKDCPTGEDEDPKFCVTLGCPEGEVACPGDGAVTCISWTAGCDGVEDCADGGDEGTEWCAKLHSLNECDDDEVLCPNPEGPDDCIRIRYACDSMDDCSDGGDENHDWCMSLPPAMCPDNKFRCVLDSYRCIPNWYTCDDFEDCLDGSDESEEVCGQENNEANNVKKRLLVETERALRMLEIKRKREHYRQQKRKNLQTIHKQLKLQTSNTDQMNRIADQTKKVVDIQEKESQHLNREEELRAILKKLLTREDSGDEEVEPPPSYLGP